MVYCIAGFKLYFVIVHCFIQLCQKIIFITQNHLGLYIAIVPVILVCIHVRDPKRVIAQAVPLIIFITYTYIIILWIIGFTFKNTCDFSFFAQNISCLFYFYKTNQYGLSVMLWHWHTNSCLPNNLSISPKQIYRSVQCACLNSRLRVSPFRREPSLAVFKDELSADSGPTAA
jgi:hypothetical protein